MFTGSSEESLAAATEGDGSGVMHRLFVTLEVVLPVAPVVAAGKRTTEALRTVVGDHELGRRSLESLGRLRRRRRRSRRDRCRFGLSFNRGAFKGRSTGGLNLGGLLGGRQVDRGREERVRFEGYFDRSRRRTQNSRNPGTCEVVEKRCLTPEEGELILS